jgi:uncharacterized protein YggE
MKAVSVVLAMFVILSSAVAQTATRTVQANTIQVGAEGKFESAPDTVVVQFNIAAQENNSRTAYDRAAKAAEQVRGILRSNGIDPKQAHVGVFSIDPVYDWRAPQRKLIGYRVSTAVELKLRDLSKAGPIVEQLAIVDTAGNQSVSYTLEDIDAAKIKAVQDAFRRARSEAEALAQAGGRTLGELSYASIDTAEQGPVPVMMRAMAAKAPSAEQAPTAEFTPQNVTITAHVSTVFTLRTKETH